MILSLDKGHSLKLLSDRFTIGSDASDAWPRSNSSWITAILSVDWPSPGLVHSTGAYESRNLINAPPQKS